uniref:Uncharacterized protein n=1 Tax=Setaria digitata TaxID=48799 RepID=A0A915Q8A7_9BILA
MIADAEDSRWLSTSKQNLFLFFFLLLSVLVNVSEQSTASESETETIEGWNRSLDMNVTANETDSEANDKLLVILKTSKAQISTARNNSAEKFCIGELCVSFPVFTAIISIPTIIILTAFIIFLSHGSQWKRNYQVDAKKSHTPGRLMPLQLDHLNSSKEIDSAKYTRFSEDSEINVEEAKPLRNLSEESELSRSVMASLSSEQEDENDSQKKSLIKKKH